MTRDGRVALALASLFAACSVYEPSVLTGDGDDDGGTGGGAPRGGSTSKGGSAGKASSGGIGNTNGGTGGANGGSGARGGSAGTPGTGGGKSGGAAGEGGALGEGGEANGGDSGEGSSGAGDGGGAGSSSGGVAGTSATGGNGAGGSNGGASGSGGTSAGSGGTSGGGKGGSGGSSGSGGTSSGEVCSGCARLSVPLTTALDKAHFIITMPANTDFEDAVVTLRVFRRAGSGGQLRSYVQHGGGPFGFASLDLGSRDIDDLGGWVDISFDLGPVTGYDKTIVRRLGIEIIGTGSSSWTNPTVIYVDSVSIENTVLNPSVFAFDTIDSVSPTPSTSSPADQRMWLNSGSNDTNVAASISWLGP